MSKPAIPQLSTGRKPGELLNITQLFGVPNDSPFGNLLPKVMWMQHRADEVNERVREAFGTWTSLLDGGSIQRHLFSIEYAVFQIRRLADDLVGCWSLLHAYVESGQIPDRVDPDKLGALLSSPHHFDHEPFKKHRAVLALLNDISNAQKHSFIGYETTMVGEREPVIYALDVKNNDRRKNNVRLHAVEVARLIQEFDAFFVEMWAHLKVLSKTTPKDVDRA